MNGERSAGRPGPAASGASLFSALAAVASIAIGLAATNAGLWLVVIVLVIGWARWSVFVGRVRFVVLPRSLAKIASTNGGRTRTGTPAKRSSTSIS